MSLETRYKKILAAMERFENEDRLDKFFEDFDGGEKQYRTHDWQCIRFEIMVLRLIAQEHYKLLGRGKQNDD